MNGSSIISNAFDDNTECCEICLRVWGYIAFVSYVHYSHMLWDTSLDALFESWYVLTCTFHRRYDSIILCYPCSIRIDGIGARCFCLTCGLEPICIINVDRDVCVFVHDMLTPLTTVRGKRYNLGLISNEILYLLVSLSVRDSSYHHILQRQ